MQLKSQYQPSPALVTFDSQPNCAFVRLPVVMALYGISPATVWRNVKNGNIPKPRKLTTRTTVWNVGELRVALGLQEEQK